MSCRSPDHVNPTKRLVLRLSSLGDVILSSSCLQTEAFAEGIDWVVAQEYASVLRGHPRIKKLWEFNRRDPAQSWALFCRRLWAEGYTEVYDLHANIRTRILRLLFFLWSGCGLRRRVSWKTASKQRFRSWGFILFKKVWPKVWLSRLQVEEFARTVGGTGKERPDLTHLLNNTDDFPAELRGKKYFCVMPGSNWPGKTWPAQKYFEMLRRMDVFPVVLGTSSDPECVRLVEVLKAAGQSHFSGIGKWSLIEAARVLARSAGYIGSDTGLAHLAEAVGTRIAVIYGPTAPGLGFEPWRLGSVTAGLDLWCRPCGKIGDKCYRVFNRNECLKSLSSSDVLAVVRDWRS